MLAMHFAKRRALSTLRSVLLAAMVVVVATALLPRGSSLRHLASPGVGSPIVRNHADRGDRMPAAVNPAENLLRPSLAWGPAPGIVAVIADAVGRHPIFRLRAPPFPF